MTKKVTVLLPDEEFDRFDAYCEERGFKKSTLLARIVRDLLEEERAVHESIEPRWLSSIAASQGTARRRARHG
jgi:hypothetical protein